MKAADLLATEPPAAPPPTTPAPEGPGRAPQGTAELAVIVPALNERANIRPLVDLLHRALDGVAWEVVFVDDDSADGTADEVRRIALTDPRVRCIQRVGRRGLSTACIEGALASAAPYVAVMDADLQHDETLLPGMLDVLRRGEADLVIGSRYATGGGMGEWGAGRVRISGLATRLSRLVCKADVSDPMSGFFMVTRPAFTGAMRRLSGRGFKILLDLLTSSPAPLRVVELPYRFRTRQHGESKLDSMVALEFGALLADKLIGHLVPIRFFMFASVGALGLLVHLAALRFSLSVLTAGFAQAQAVATFVAMTFNFFLNNAFTYRDQRLRGGNLLRGLLSFYLICGLGAAANVGVAWMLFDKEGSWWLAGVAGALLGLVWNYAASSVYTWRARG